MNEVAANISACEVNCDSSTMRRFCRELKPLINIIVGKKTIAVADWHLAKLVDIRFQHEHYTEAESPKNHL